MRTGAIFARGSCRALKWSALLGVVFMLVGAGQAAAQTTPNHAVVSLDSSAVVKIVLKGDVTLAEAATDDPAGKDIREAFTMAGYTVSSTGTPVERADGTEDLAGYTIVSVTFTTAVTGSPTVVYKAPGTRDGRLQTGGTQDVAGFSHVVRPAQPVLPVIADKSVQKNALVREELPMVSSGGMLPIEYRIQNDTGDAAIDGNITVGTGDDEKDSGLRFDADARSIVGVARDIGV